MGKTMRVTPQKRYSSAGYPTHDDVDERPDLLRHIPARWQTNPAVLTALASVTMLSATNLAIAGGEKAKAKPVRIAPVFQHGEGRGEFGCMVTSPPVCLSEDEARQIINDEVKRLGFSFDAPRSERLRQPLDGIDSKRKFAYVFVSRTDGTTSYGATASEAKTLSRAREITTQLRREPSVQTVGVFYDPMPGTAPSNVIQFKRISLAKDRADDELAARLRQDELAKNTPKEAAKQLRLQVRDFVKWLKAQGVI